MKWNVGAKMGIGFGTALVIFLIVGLVSYLSVSQLVRASDIRKHTYDVLVQIAEVHSLLKDIQLGQRGFVITGDEIYLTPYQGAVDKLERSIDDLRTLTVDNTLQQDRIDKLDPLIATRLSLSKQAIETRRTAGLEPAAEIVKSGKGEANMEEIGNLLADIHEDEEELLETRTGAAEAGAQIAIWTIFLGSLTAAAFAALAGFLITRNIAGPLRELTVLAERITVGDLSTELPPTDRKDEVGILTRSFSRMTGSLRTLAGTAEQIAVGNLQGKVEPQSPKDVMGVAFARMTENLRSQIGGLVEGANLLGSASGEIVASTTQLATSASESATAVSETTTTVEEVRQTAQVASQKAKLVSESAQKAAHVTLSGRKAAEEAGAGMERIRQQMEGVAASMMRLSEQNQTIGQIIATVEDLASQSNLLAVNASIEAAKAGEHGKGFSVVALEVKSLAEQSRQATNQVRTILGDVQKATTMAVMATEQGSKAVELGIRQTAAASESIQSLSDSVSEAAQAATQIAASSQQQLVGVDQVVGAMESIKQASAQNLASAKQLETAARNLNDLGQRIKQMVDQYRV